MRDLIEEYADSLARLSGTPFQDEVCARLQGAILGFQTVPAKPHGDAGLDGFSHDGDRGYCCYGLEHDAFKRNDHRETAIVKKFRSDLRRLCELGAKGKKLVRIESPEMATILPAGQKLKHIQLLVNWFESHRILSPILSAFGEYKKASECRHVDPNATVNVVGPRQLANSYAIDEETIYRSQQRVFIQRVQEISDGVEIEESRNFESKMASLREIRPDQLDAIDALVEQLLESWRTSLAVERELDETLPDLHRLLEQSRRQILTRVGELMLETDQPWTALRRASLDAEEILKRNFHRQFGPLIADVSSGEIARLIGECPIGWDKPEGLG